MNKNYGPEQTDKRSGEYSLRKRVTYEFFRALYLPKSTFILLQVKFRDSNRAFEMII